MNSTYLLYARPLNISRIELRLPTPPQTLTDSILMLSVRSFSGSTELPSIALSAAGIAGDRVGRFSVYNAFASAVDADECLEEMAVG